VIVNNIPGENLKMKIIGDISMDCKTVLTYSHRDISSNKFIQSKTLIGEHVFPALIEIPLSSLVLPAWIGLLE
jgi:hypothetical protein